MNLISILISNVSQFSGKAKTPVLDRQFFSSHLIQSLFVERLQFLIEFQFSHGNLGAWQTVTVSAMLHQIFSDFIPSVMLLHQ